MFKTLNRVGYARFPHLVSFWGVESNPHYAPLGNDGSYSQPCGGAVFYISGIGDVIVEFDDTSCGDFGRRWNAAVTIATTGQKWFFGVDRNQDDEDIDADMRWNVAASYGVYRATHGIGGQWLVNLTSRAVKSAVEMQR